MKPLPQPAQMIISSLNEHGFEAYAIGGSVRDVVLGRQTKGWDFTTNATPEQILEVFPDSFYDNQFGTVGVKIYADESPITNNQSPNQNDAKDINSQAPRLRQGFGGQASSNNQTISTNNQIPNNGEESEKPIDIYEVTTYRSEKGYTDNRHPDQVVWGQSLEEDLSRRDFTINAMAYDGKNLIDPYGGQTDLNNKIIRTVGDPQERFEEDALRIMRAVRIATQLGFLIEPKTQSAIQAHAKSLLSISKERVRDELFKILESNYPADGILLLKNTGILAVVLPELEEAFAVPQKSPKRHHIYDVGTHSVEALRFCPSKDPVVRLATLLHDIGKVKTYKKDETTGLITFFNHEMVSNKMCKVIIERLRLSKKQSEKILSLVRWHQFTVDENQTDSAIRRFIRHVGKENLLDMLDLRVGDRLGGGARETSWRLELFKKRLAEVQLQPFSVKDLKINGNDVIKLLGVTPGPIVGQTLQTLFAEVEAETLENSVESLTRRVMELKSN